MTRKASCSAGSPSDPKTPYDVLEDQSHASPTDPGFLAFKKTTFDSQTRVAGHVVFTGTVAPDWQ